MPCCQRSCWSCCATGGAWRSQSCGCSPGDLESTVRYLGIEVDEALNIAEQIEL
jgi:hypothetical protein